MAGRRHFAGTAALLLTAALGTAVTRCEPARGGATVRGHELEQVFKTRSPPARDGTVRVKRRRMKVLIARDRVRLQQEDDTATIIRLDKGVIYEVDDSFERYEQRSIKAIRRQRASEDKLTLEQIEGTPPGHPNRVTLVEDLADGPRKWEEIWKLPPGEGRSRLVAKYRLPEKPPLRIEVRRTKETEEVAGVECRRYESLENGQATDRALIAEGLAFDKRYYEFMELTGWIAPELADGLRKAKTLKRGKGLPLESIMHFRMGGSVEIKTEAVTAREFDAATFEVPAAYKERERRSTFK